MTTVSKTPTPLPTGIVYDERMCLHQSDSKSHPESPLRIKAIYAYLEKTGLLKRCVSVPPREATTQELLRAHTPAHIANIDYTSIGNQYRPGITCNYLDGDTFVCKESSLAARLAAGCVSELAHQVIEGKVRNGFAIVRPPGHHCNKKKASGFCLYNNVAVAVKSIQAKYPDKKIAIVDWDVHFGDGSSEIFYADGTVLYFSIHRYGNFYPNKGSYEEVGTGAGLGKNINVPMKEGEGDTEYFHVWNTILLPVLREYKPDLIFVSAGFDCVIGDPLGGMEVTPKAFAHLTSGLTNVAPVVMALEGGYDLDAISKSIHYCISTLLGDLPPSMPWVKEPSDAFLKSFKKILKLQLKYWKLNDV